MTATQGASRWKRLRVWLGGALVTAVLIPIALAWSGILDYRPRIYPSPTASPRGAGKWLSGESPVKVWWTGVGDTIEISWVRMEYPELDHYSLDVYGLAPIETWYNVGYRRGNELRTTDVTNPISLTNEHFSRDGEDARVDNNQTWRVCVRGMMETPGGVSIAPYIIDGSERCSDPFTIPAP